MKTICVCRHDEKCGGLFWHHGPLDQTTVCPSCGRQQVPLPAEDERFAELKKALGEAILSTHRVNSRCVEFDPAGSEYELTWTKEVERWAKLCGLDLSKHNPFFYSRK